MEIRRVGENDKIGEFINVAFSEYAADCGVALTTFGFQAPEFYKKLGYEWK